MDLQRIITTLVIVLIIMIVYYFSTWQRKKEQKELKKMQDNLKKGDKVITYSGFSGEIEQIEEDRVIIKTRPDKQRISIEKWAIAGLDDRSID